MEWVLLLIVAVIVLAIDAEQRAKAKRRKEAYQFTPKAYVNPNCEASARWADDKVLKKAGLFKGKGWRIGQSQSGKPLHYGGPGNLILVAPARSGKMVSVLAGALLERPNPIASRLIVDSKGELCAITHARAAQFSETVAIDPMGCLKKLGVKGVKIVGCNPLAAIDRKSLSLATDIDAVTDGVFLNDTGGGENASFFNDSAALLLSEGIRALVKFGGKDEKNLVAVREQICRDVFAFANKYARCGDAVIEAELSRYTSKQARESKSLEDVLSTFRTQTAFLSMEGIRESLMHDGVRAVHLKRRPMTVYLILPLETLGTPAAKWFRLLLSTWLCELLKAGPRGLGVLCVVDEFFSIGHIKTFQTAMSQAAGAAGMQLWPILQCLSQLENLYGNQGWRTFLSCSSVKLFFGGANLDKQTSEYISELCGEQSIIVQSRNIQEDHRNKDVNVSNGANASWERLIRPHQVRRMHDREMIVVCEKVAGPILAQRRPYWEGGEFHGYRPNPYAKKQGGGFGGWLFK
jgi:type IV secretion system protein VirD4